MGAPAIAPGTNLLVVLAALILAVGAGSMAGQAGPDEMMLVGLALAASVALAATPVAMYLSFRLGVMDVPDERNRHERPIPLLGGSAVFAAFAVASAVTVAALPARCVPDGLRLQWVATLVAGGLIAAMGIADDKWGLKPGARLLGQLAAICLVMKYGLIVSFLPPTAAGRAGEVVLTGLWIIGITNAMNFLDGMDGMDGLASGVSAIAALSFGVIAAMSGQTMMATAAFCVAGAALGFLRYSFRPAVVHLGDSGATLLGFVLACLAIMGDWGAPDRMEDLLAPVMVLAIPLYYTIYITIYRVRQGRVRSFSAWAAYVGRDHLRHRLLQMGMQRGRACLLICLGGAVLGALALILTTKGELDRHDKFLALLVAGAMFVGATVLMELGRSARKAGRDGEPTAP